MYSKIKYCSLIWNFKDKQDNCGAELIIAGQFTFHKLRTVNSELEKMDCFSNY